jgi:CDP-glycerol glycerophosphotransferase (TagB/SpsB family)
MEYLGYLFLLAGRVILFPIYFLSGFFPRRSNLWVFGSWGGYRFADNSAAFFTYCQAAVSENVDLVWISRDQNIVTTLRKQGCKAYWLWSPRGLFNCLRAGVHIFDCFSKDTNYWLSRGSKQLNLWNGVPLKVFERDIETDANRYNRLFHGNIVERSLLGLMMPWHISKPDLAIATSDETALIVSRAFALSESQVCVTGLPRNDAIFASPSAVELDIGMVPQKYRDAVAGLETVYLYLPTFRDNGAEYIDIDWEELDEKLGRINSKFFIKIHPEDRDHYIPEYANIIQLPRLTEVSALLPGADVLVSDYSSIIFDYMLLNRPIIYYIPDLVKFESDCRSFNFHPREVAIGPVCENFAELLGALEQIHTGTTNISSAHRDEIMARIHNYSDARSNERVLALIEHRFLAGSLVRNKSFSADQSVVIEKVVEDASREVNL